MSVSLCVLPARIVLCAAFGAVNDDKRQKQLTQLKLQNVFSRSQANARVLRPTTRTMHIKAWLQHNTTSVRVILSHQVSNPVSSARTI